MFNSVRAFLLSLTIIAVLVFSAVGTTVAYADGDNPPDSAPVQTSGGEECDSDDDECSQEAEQPEEGKPGPGSVDTVETTEPETVATEAPAEEATPPSEGEATPVPTVERPSVDPFEPTPVPTEEETPPAEEPGAAPPTPVVETPILTTVPDNTNVTVLNAQGEAQPLVSRAASQAIESGIDPIWCPEGQSPTPGANGCTQSFNSFTALLNFLSGNATYTGPGTIYVEEGNYQGGESTINFNNFNLSNLSSSNLTITGGWNTATGSTTGTSTFNNVSIIIGNSGNPWGGSLTLNNITITNPSGTGITANSQNAVTLSNVNVTNSTNGAGAEITAGTDVNINNSKFERNKTAGVIIRALRDVSIANSSFSNPANARRQIIGLDIITDGSVSLLNVLANGNRQAGATIEAGGPVSIANSTFSGTKSILGSEFLGYGLTVVSQDVINLDGVTANDNFLWGASLTAAGDISIANSNFNANTTESPGFIDDTGLLVTSGGNVSIFNSHADDNRLIGATITAAGDVSISGSTFSSNNGITIDSAGNPTFHGYGLQVVTDGSIFLEGVVASGNTLFGAHLEAGVDVVVSSSDFSNQTSGSTTALTGRGLEVIAGGNVLLQNVTFNNNQTFGANIQAGLDILLSGVTASGNGTNGVNVETANCGTLFLVGGTYINNGEYGLNVLGTQISQTVAPTFSGNGLGNINQDPGTCVFTPVNPPTTPAQPPVYKPNDYGAVPYNPGANSLARTLDLSGLNGDLATFNSFLAQYDPSRSGLQIGPFVGRYAYVYLASGMQIVMYPLSTPQQLVMNGS
jgi:hypothetical protein